MSLFGGQKRRRGSIHLYFIGDYVDAKNNLPVQKVLHKFNDNKILFADYVEKIDTKWKHSQRLLLCKLFLNKFYDYFIYICFSTHILTFIEN